MQFLGGNRALYAGCALAWVAITLSLASRERGPAYERVASANDLTRYAKTTLAELQARSIRENKEFCGVIFEDSAGTLSTSRIYEGGRAQCDLDWGVPLGNHVVASFHTHGGFDLDYDSERPSIDDMENDVDARIDGFISTPGGRIWKIDWKDEVATQVCGEACLEQDPRYLANGSERVEPRYAMDDLYFVLPPDAPS